MSLVRVDTKQIECLNCGQVGRVAKFIPLRFAWCPFCRSPRIRIYKASTAEPKKGKK